VNKVHTEEKLFMELVGTSEIASIAQVSRSTVCNWVARNPSFPKPVAELACGQIWTKQEIEAWLVLNMHLTESDMNAKANLQIGQVYTHDFICKTFGGDAKSGTYLPQALRVIQCGCFTTRMNPKAPECVLVGNAPRVLAKAEKLAAQGGSIPVFIKIGINQWEYTGKYELLVFSKNQADFEAAAVEADRNDVIGALFFKKILDNASE
jgi:predicted DNA-binding transcriptional regulator AlpA